MRFRYFYDSSFRISLVTFNWAFSLKVFQYSSEGTIRMKNFKKTFRLPSFRRHKWFCDVQYYFVAESFARQLMRKQVVRVVKPAAPKMYRWKRD